MNSTPRPTSPTAAHSASSEDVLRRMRERDDRRKEQDDRRKEQDDKMKERDDVLRLLKSELESQKIRLQLLENEVRLQCQAKIKAVLIREPDQTDGEQGFAK